MTVTTIGRSGAHPDGARVFESLDAPADPAALGLLGEEVRDADLAAPAVVLPDFHHKSNMEMPSSIAIATRETIRPTFTSASVNCGMALIALDLERPGPQAVAAFYRDVQRRSPYPPGLRRTLSAADVVRCATEGGAFAVERFGVDPSELDRVEEQGRLDLEPFGGAERGRRELPWLFTRLARLRFGTIGPSNHFVELQQVEEVLDPERAERLGVRPGQVTLHYHAGGGVLAGLLGGLYGRRKHSPKPLRAIMAVQKPLSHLASARSAGQVRERLRLYFRDGSPPIPRTSPEAKRILLANAMAMNYGFAFRLATYRALRDAAEAAFGPHASRLVVDSPHNSVYEETVGGEPAMVHRHNSCRAYPPSLLGGHPAFAGTGQPLLLPGTHRTSSYLCVADEGAAQSLHSAPHGAGSLISDLVARGRSGPDVLGRTTARFTYRGVDGEPVPQLDDRGVDASLRILTGHRIVRPVARMRPFAVLH